MTKDEQWFDNFRQVAEDDWRKIMTEFNHPLNRWLYKQKQKYPEATFAPTGELPTGTIPDNRRNMLESLTGWKEYCDSWRRCKEMMARSRGLTE